LAPAAWGPPDFAAARKSAVAAWKSFIFCSKSAQFSQISGFDRVSPPEVFCLKAFVIVIALSLRPTAKVTKSSV
jgi:hypothetical protein